MAIKTRSVEYYDGDTLLEAYIAFDDRYNTPRPGVLVSHAWVGRDVLFCQKAEALAALGYVGFALDMYGKNIRGQSPAENAALMQPFISDRSLLQRRISLALSTLKQQAEVDEHKTAALGYCFGGMCVLDLARSGATVDGVICTHGLLSAPQNISTNSTAKILILHGDQDPLSPLSQVMQLSEELKTANADWQIHIYSNTQHAFTNPAANAPQNGMQYNSIAAERAWQSTQNFLTEIFSA
ncbi:MAG: dienelactone hydrolase family protein [Gammaproteobacteria bacterium]|nr:dienelactone hydrolase family protein [Gammaproteobacteria bacterium]